VQQLRYAKKKRLRLLLLLQLQLACWPGSSLV
jgi:hypothetical protein